MSLHVKIDLEEFGKIRENWRSVSRAKQEEFAFRAGALAALDALTYDGHSSGTYPDPIERDLWVWLDDEEDAIAKVANA